MHNALTCATFLISLLAFTVRVEGQATSLTYQGRLAVAGQPANGCYDFRFALTDAETGGNQMGQPVTNAAVLVSNGLFTTVLQPGAASFDGSSRWLEVSVRTNGSSAFYTTLTPRQLITPAPYATFASVAGNAGWATNLAGGGAALTNVPAASLTGTVPLAQLSGITWSQMDTGTWQAATNGVSSAALQAATNLLAAGFSLSVNTANLRHLQRALNSGRAPRILWLGDSICDNTFEAVVRLFETYWPAGVQRGAFLTGYPRYYTTQTGPWGLDAVPGYWNVVFVLTNTAVQTYGGPSTGGYVYADTVQLWYLREPGGGSARIEVSTNMVAWQPVATINANAGSGLTVTNFPIIPGNYAARIISLGGGSANRFSYVWEGLLDSQSKGLVASLSIAYGRDLGDFVAMGSDNVAVLLTNVNPDLIIYEQKKDSWTRTNWPPVAALLQTYASHADVCVMAGPIGNGSNDYPTPNPTNSSYAIALLDRSVAISNGWAFVDDYTPLNDWPNIIVANGFNSDNVVHLSEAGKLYAGSLLVRQLGLQEMVTAARPNGVTPPGWSGGAGSPEGRVIAPPGSLYTRTDGGAGTTLYVKESGTGSTGWIAK